MTLGERFCYKGSTARGAHIWAGAGRRRNDTWEHLP